MIIKAFKNWLNRRAQKRDAKTIKRIEEFRSLSAKLVSVLVLNEIMTDSGLKKESYAMHSGLMRAQEIALDMAHIANTMYFSQYASKSLMKHELYSVMLKVEGTIKRPITDRDEVMAMIEAL